MKSHLFVFIFILSSFNILQAQVEKENNSSNASAELDVPNFLRVYPLSSIGGSQVEVYKNNNKNPQYFYNPFILVEWEDFKKKLDQFKSEDENKNITLSIRMHHYYDKAYYELKRLLEIDENISKINLSPLPHTYYVLKAKIGEEYLILNPNDIPTFSAITKQQIIHITPKDIAYTLSGTIKQLKHFYDTREVEGNITGKLYTGGFEFSSDFVLGSADFANSSTIKKKIFGDGELIDNQIVHSNSENGGLSLSLGSLKLGGGKVESVVWTDNKKKRIVNRNYLSDLISDNKAEIHVLSMGDPDKIRETKNQIIDFLLHNVATNVELEFNKNPRKNTIL